MYIRKDSLWHFQHLDPPMVFDELEVGYWPTGGRFYQTPEGDKFPSVTTILGLGTDQSWKDEWIKRVGQAEADRVSKQATTRGTAVHELIESYMNNNPDWQKGAMPANVMSVKKVLPVLEKNVSLIYANEAPLWSSFLRTAGRVDCIGVWNGILSIIDFKTSKRQKNRGDITNYFMQTAMYAYMFYERKGIPIPQLVIVITVDDGPSQVFIEKTKLWLPEAIKIRKLVEEKHGL